MTTLVRVSGLRAPKGREVLHDVDLALDSGEITALIGPNGAGKSTLVNVLAGILHYAGGTIERRGRVAASLQTPALAGRSVRANLRLALRWWGCPRSEWNGRIDSALSAIKADHLGDRHARTLSGGEARRVHLARALALEPDVLLLDEPFAGLDPNTRAELLYDAGSALRHPRRATLVVVHDRAEAWALADRVAVMLDGRIVENGTPSDVFEHPSSADVATFVGFAGALRDGAMLRMYRPADVRVDPQGDIRVEVQRAIPVEDGVRLELAHPAGRLIALAPRPAPDVGDAISVTLAEGITVRAEPLPQAAVSARADA